MAWTPDGDALRDRVALVAGATRGAGRGIAAALGEAGATGICTGRSSVSGNAGSDYDRPETIEETAELVTSLGGVGIPIQVDHLDIAQVQGLADRIRDDHGAIDILVNDIWGADMESADLGTRPRRWPANTTARRRHPSDHRARSAAAAGRSSRRTAHRSD